MRVEEIALRQEIRQMLNEAGINREALSEMAKKLLHEEIEKRVGIIVNEPRIENVVNSKLNSYEFKDMLRGVVAEEIRKSIKISVNVIAENKSVENER